MRILALSAQIPYPPHTGKAMRDYHLLTGLACKHRLHLLCMVGSAAEVEAAAPLSEKMSFQATARPAHHLPRRMLALFASRWPDLAWRTRSASFQRMLENELRRDPPDLLLMEGLEMAAYGLRARAWLQQPHTRSRLARGPGKAPALVLDAHNAEFLLQQRAWEIGRRTVRDWPAALYSWVQAGRLAGFEALACRHADHVVAVSPADREALRRIAPGAAISVVPNGVDTAEYAPLPAERPAGPPRLVFTGQMSFRPNVDAVQWFCGQIWPRVREHMPQARFQIVGRDPAPAVGALGEHPGVEVVGAVPDDRPYIGGADLYVLPMRFGGGIRFKLLQALSMEQAVVSTSLGAEGVEGLVDGQHLVLAEQAEAFAARTVELLRDPQLRKRLGQAGRELIVARYDWQALLPRFEAALLAARQQED